MSEKEKTEKEVTGMNHSVVTKGEGRVEVEVGIGRDKWWREKQNK